MANMNFQHLQCWIQIAFFLSDQQFKTQDNKLKQENLTFWNIWEAETSECLC